MLRALMCCHLALLPHLAHIQAAWRALPTKRRWQRVRGAARKVVRTWRRSGRYKRWHELVQRCVVQRQVLRWLARRRFVRLRCAAKLVSLQLRLRQRRLVRDLHARYAPFAGRIVWLQRWWRAVLQRRRYLLLRGQTRRAAARALQLGRRAAFRSNRAIGQLLQLSHLRMAKLRRFWYPYELAVYDRVVKVLHQQRPSSAAAAPQGAPGGSGRCGTPRVEAQATGRPTTCLGRSS